MPTLTRLHKELIIIQSAVKNNLEAEKEEVNIFPLIVRKIKPNLISSCEVLVVSF